MNRYLNLSAKCLNYTTAGYFVLVFNWILLAPFYNRLEPGHPFVCTLSSVLSFVACFILAGHGHPFSKLAIWSDFKALLRSTRYEYALYQAMRTNLPLNSKLYWTNYDPWNEDENYLLVGALSIIAGVISSCLPGHLFRLNLFLAIPALILLSWFLIGKYYRAKRQNLGDYVLVLPKKTHQDPETGKFYVRASVHWSVDDRFMPLAIDQLQFYAK